ncbi:MAG: signal peptidase I [Clostridia bacterium]|nr:signal peptidase I [Clostridia bacterium]
MKNKRTEFPQSTSVEKELKREKYRQKFKLSLKSTFFTLITVAAIAVLVATLWLPVLEIYGDSMSPCLNDGEIVVSVKSKTFDPGEVIAFYYNNKVLIKRVIATSGDWVDIKEDGTVFINNKELDEPYLEEKALGDCDIELPYQVPENKVFVIGDHRSVSVDSRNTAVGCISEDQIVGKIVYKVWPYNAFGAVN